MREIKSGRHSKHLLVYHIVWIVKYRRRILVGPVVLRLKELIQHAASEREWDIVSMEVMPDHVHLFVSPPPTVSPADAVKVFKGISARLLLKDFPDLARKTGRGTLWAPSYFVGSAGDVSALTIQRYIEEQHTRE